MRQTVMDLSINRRADTGTAGTTIRKVTDTLDFPQYKVITYIGSAIWNELLSLNTNHSLIFVYTL